MTATTTPDAVVGRPARGPAHVACLASAGLLLADAVIGLVADVGDHTSGAGMVSEVVVGLAFLAGAVALALLRPVAGWRALLWWCAPAGLAVAGATMVGVPVVGSEPAEWLFVVAVLPTFVGLVAAGVLGTRRLWPWWTGAGVALLLPIMFLLPLNSLWMAVVWLAVALRARSR